MWKFFWILFGYCILNCFSYFLDQLSRHPFVTSEIASWIFWWNPTFLYSFRQCCCFNSYHILHLLSVYYFIYSFLLNSSMATFDKEKENKRWEKKRKKWETRKNAFMRRCQFFNDQNYISVVKNGNIWVVFSWFGLFCMKVSLLHSPAVTFQRQQNHSLNCVEILQSTNAFITLFLFALRLMSLTETTVNNTEILET